MSFTQSDISSRAAAVVGESQLLDYGAGGVSDPSRAWEAFQRTTAKAVLADPDIILYLAYLCSNKASATARKILPVLESFIAAVEGLKYAQKEISSPSSVQRSLSIAQSGETVTSSQLDQLSAATEKYIAEELAPAISSGSRLQVQGDEARSQYEVQKAALLDSWGELLSLVDRCQEDRKFTAEVAQEIAQASALSALETATNADSSTSTTDYTLTLAATLAAVEASRREVDWRWRVRIDTSTTFPATITAQLAGNSLILSQEAVLLGLKSGDLVSWGAESSVLSYSDSTVTLTDEVPGTGVLLIRAAAVVDWENLSSSLKTISLPTVAQLRTGIQSREGGSAGHIRDLAVYLAELYAKLDAVTSAIQGTVSRLGGSVEDESSTLLAVLDAYSPFFSSKTSAGGDALLDKANGGGFDYAARQLLEGDIDGILSSTAQSASLMGRVDEAVTALGRYTS